MGRLIGFGIWAGVPLFWIVDPRRALADGDVGWFGVGFGYGRGRRNLGRVWRIILGLGCLIMEGLRVGFGIWAGIPLFWAVDPVRAIPWGYIGRFGVAFGHR